MQGYFKIFVLKELMKSEKTGYDLMKALEDFSGTKMPSPGTIYPLLNDLLQKKMVTVSAKENKKLYKISKKGEKILNNLLKERKKALEKIIGMLGDIYDKKEISRIRMSLNVISGKNVPKDFDILSELRESIFSFATSSRYRKKRNDFRVIIKNATSKIKNLR